MPCSRCRGMMVEDHSYDFYVDYGHLSMGAWRCVSCGNVVDPLILKNRQMRKSQKEKSYQSRVLFEIYEDWPAVA